MSLIKGCEQEFYQDISPPILLKKSPLDPEITRCWNVQNIVDCCKSMLDYSIYKNKDVEKDLSQTLKNWSGKKLENLARGQNLRRDQRLCYSLHSTVLPGFLNAKLFISCPVYNNLGLQKPTNLLWKNCDIWQSCWSSRTFEILEPLIL